MTLGHPSPAGVHRELWELVDAVCSGTITAESRARLEEILLADESHRLYYLTYVDIHASSTGSCGSPTRKRVTPPIWWRARCRRLRPHPADPGT